MRCGRTTRRAARCAASVRCRPPSPARRRWTSSPRPCGMDPVELRLQNALKTHDQLLTGQVITGTAPVQECIRACLELPLPPAADPGADLMTLPGGAGRTALSHNVRRGTGFAVGFKNLAFSEGFDDYSSARVRLELGADGEPVATVHVATAEVGQGFVTLAQQIARAELGVDSVVLHPADTQVGSAGSTRRVAADHDERRRGADGLRRGPRGRPRAGRPRPAPGAGRHGARRRRADHQGRRAQRVAGRRPAGRAGRGDRRVPPRADRPAGRGRAGQRALVARLRRAPGRRRRRRGAGAGPGRADRHRPGRRQGR